MAMALFASIASSKWWRWAYALLAVWVASFVLLIAAAALANREGAGLDDPAAAAAQVMQARAAIVAAEEAYDVAHRAAQSAADEYELSHAEFLEFLHAHFSKLPTPSQHQLEDTAASAPIAAATPESPWAQLRGQLAVLHAYHARLLGSLPPSHPSVGAVDLAIADSERKLRALGPEPAEPAPQREAAISADQSTSADDTAAAERAAARAIEACTAQVNLLLDRLQEDGQRFQTLAKELKQSRQAYGVALEREQRAWQHQVQTLADNPAALGQFSALAAAARTRRTIEICGYLALGLAICVALWARGTERTFRTEAEVRQVLDLQILGMLPRETDAPPGEMPRREPRWVSRAVRASEIWLLAVAVLLAVMVVVDSRFLSELIADPLAACSRKFWC